MGIATITERIVDGALRKVRMGFYHATISSSPDEFQRQDGDAEWGPTLKKLRRISSPIVDVVAPLGARMAVLSQDGVPEFGATIGQVWDDLGTPKKMTAWLRANLLKHPGHVELGVLNGSIQIRIRTTNSGEMTPLANGKMYIGTDAVELLTELSAALGKLQNALFQLGAATATPTIVGSSPLANAATFINLGTQIATIKAKIDLVKP